MNKNKILKTVADYDKKIEKTKEKLEDLENKRNAVLLGGMMGKLEEGNYSLNDFFGIIEKDINEKNKYNNKTDIKMGEYNK
ncbi:MAG: hypothetical protein IJS61_08660 [Firmicutes bacterium]|nr:hypothetical protein [Bacillota bacterium]